MIAADARQANSALLKAIWLSLGLVAGWVAAEYVPFSLAELTSSGPASLGDVVMLACVHVVLIGLPACVFLGYDPQEFTSHGVWLGRVASYKAQFVQHVTQPFGAGLALSLVIRCIVAIAASAS